MITHEETDFRVGQSDAQSLSVNTAFSPKSTVPQRYRKRCLDAMRSDTKGFCQGLACVELRTDSCPQCVSRCGALRWSLPPHLRRHRCKARAGVTTNLRPSCRVRSACLPHTVWSATPGWRRGDAGAVHPTHARVEPTESGRATFIVNKNDCSISISCSCELMIKPSTCTALYTLRARSTTSVGCVSDRARPSLDVSTSAKCSWKSRNPQTVQCPL